MGGGMCNIASSPTVTNCTFSGNSTGQFGGGMYNQSIGPALVNCTFSGNTARDGGGGICNNVNSNTMVTNCTFSGNSTEGYGGGMYNFNDSNPTITNCVLWSNTASLSGPQISGLATVTYSDVQGGWSGTGNIDADPLFADDDLRLSTGSPCINAGSNAALPPDTADLDGDGDTTEPIPLDLDDNARIFNSVVDMGAYELQEVTLFGWVFMPPDAPDFGYSVNEADLVYFYSFDFVQSFNTTTGGWSIHMPMGWVYFDWPFYYELDTGVLWFAYPPESGIGVYHFITGQWEVLPRIIP
jgi:hypothetical protein